MKIESGWTNLEYEYPDDRPVTPEEFKNLMVQIRNDIDGYEESWHSSMDDLMCRVLIDLGYGEGVDIFYNTPKWYS